jgi:hypothetical protein
MNKIANNVHACFDVRTYVQEFLERAFGEGMRVAINCSFGDKMEGKERTSLSKQIMLSHNFMKAKRVPVGR